MMATSYKASELVARQEQAQHESMGMRGRHYVPLPQSNKDGVVTSHAVQTILAEPQFLYELWNKVELIPRWQEFVVSVEPISTTVSHWVMGDPQHPEGKQVEFDSEVIESVPGQRLAWRSISESLHQEGSVTFASTARGTRVVLIQSTKVPAGTLGNSAAAGAKRSPEQIVRKNLRHFKQLAEAGEIPLVEGQPNGPRGLSGKIKSWMYGENNPTPPGTSDDSVVSK